MNTIGLIGGMSWESTQTYYRLINEGVKQRLGGLHSAQLVMLSVDFAPLEKLQAAGNWEAAGELMVDAALRLEAAGADALMICTNTMHRVAPAVEQACDLPLLHIADATGRQLREQGQATVALLGTAFTMEQDFYTGRLRERFGLQVLVPDAQQRSEVHRIIYSELCLSKILPTSRQYFVRVIDALAARGAESVILGCTEIGLLISQQDTSVSLLDTTELHARHAVDFLLTE